ncbi:MAG: protein O-mannosyl-transferase family [Candidatus Polarisedimenticolia bacterium]
MNACDVGSGKPHRPGALDLLARPYLVFLGITLLYVAFPSYHFNADALHYNLLALLTAQDPAVLFQDRTVATHFLWHLLAAAVVGVTKPANPEQSLYALRALNIVLALASIFVFMQIVRASAGRHAAAWAGLILAFSHACLRSFLSVEVYALNNLVLAGLLFTVQRLAARGLDAVRTLDALFLALLTILAIATHAANALVVPALLVFFGLQAPRKAVRLGAVYAAATSALFLAMLGGIGVASGGDIDGAARMFFNYAGDTDAFVSADVVRSLGVSLGSTAEGFLGPYAAWILVPLGMGIWYGAGRWRQVRFSSWIGFLIAYVFVMALFLGIWDPGNIEHKIAMFPPLLLLATAVHASTGRNLQGAALAGAVLIALLVVAVGVAEGARPYTRIEDYSLFHLSSEIRSNTKEDEVVVVGLASERAGHPVTLAAMTFFNQRVVVLNQEDPGFEEKLRAYRERRFAVLEYEKEHGLRRR